MNEKLAAAVAVGASFILSLPGQESFAGSSIDLPSPVSVISAETLQTGSVTRAADIVNRLPGIAEPMLMVDGVRRSTTELTDIPLESIEKVEVLRDGASAVFGIDAVAGVVNIITRQPAQEPDLATRFSGYYGLNIAYDSPRWCNHWGDTALLPFGLSPVADIADRTPVQRSPSTQSASGENPFTGKRPPQVNAYDLNMQTLGLNYIKGITGKDASGGFKNPTDWFDGNPLPPTFVMGLVFIKDMYWRQLTEMRNQLQQLINMSEEGRLALYKSLIEDARKLKSAHASMQITDLEAHAPRPSSTSTWEGQYKALLSLADRAERAGNATEAADYRHQASRTRWAVWLRERRRFAELADANPLLALKADGDFLFDEIAAMEDAIAVPGLVEAFTQPTVSDYNKRRLDMLNAHLAQAISEMDETREEISNERSIDELVKYAGPQYLRQQQAVSLMGAQEGATFGRDLMGEVQATHTALEADDAFWDGVADGVLSTLAVGSVLVPVVGPFLSGGFALVEITRDGTDMIIKYRELGDAESTAAATGHQYIIQAQDAASAAKDRFIFTTLTSIADVAAIANIRVVRGGAAGDVAEGVRGGSRAAGSADEATAAIARSQDVLPAGARPHVSPAADADDVLNRIDGDALSARYLQDDISASELADFARKNGLEPKETIVSGGQTYHVSQPFEAPGGRTAVMVFQETGTGSVVPRTFYLSNEHGLWRNLPAVQLSPGGARQWSKGPMGAPVETGKGPKAFAVNEGSVDIGAEMQGSLDNMLNTHGVKKLDDADAARAATGHIELTTPDRGPKELGATIKGDDVGHALPFDANQKLPAGMRPDWSKGPKSTSAIDGHPLYGRLERFTYLSEDSTTLWVINRAENGDVWIASVQDAEAGLTGFGVRWEAYKADQLTTQPFVKQGDAYVPARNWQNDFNKYAKGNLPTSSPTRVPGDAAPSKAAAAGPDLQSATKAPADPLKAVRGAGAGVPVSVLGGNATARTMMRVEDAEPPLPLEGVTWEDVGFDQFPVQFIGASANFGLDLPLLDAGIGYLDEGAVQLPIDDTPRTSSVLHFDAPAGADPLQLLAPDLRPYYARSFGSNPKVVVLRYPETLSASVESAMQNSSSLFFGPNWCRNKQVPSDPYFQSTGSFGQQLADQWSLARIGLGGKEKKLWKLVENAAPVTVAVIDSGLDWFHRDFDRANLWVNDDEVADNGIDDDGNGYVDDVIGWDFLDNDNRPWDRDGHGTFVAGLIAAAHNDAGIAGVNPGARIMVLKALNSFGNTRASFLSEAIFYAVDNGARVINLSVGGKGISPTERIAIEHAIEKGVLVVVASGNEGVDVGDYGIASFPEVLVVGASDGEDRVPAFSNFGAVDMVAPGVDILSLRGRRTDLMMGIAESDYVPGANAVGEDRRYIHATGTSFAAPLVTAVASLLLAGDPGLGADDLARILTQTARDIEAPGVDNRSGFGVLDAAAALAADPDYHVDALITGVAAVQADGQVAVRVSGTVDADRFKSARVEIGAGETPSRFTPVSERIRKPVRDGVLADIPAASLAGSGVWIIRVVTERKSGSSREYRFRLQLG